MFDNSSEGITTSFIMSSKKSDFLTNYEQTINLDPEKIYEASLLSLDMYNSIPNITKGENNTLKYSSDDGLTWKIIALDTGSYQVEDINNEIQRIMTGNGDCGDHGIYNIEIT